MKNILIINGHPNKESFNYALSQAYIDGASTTNANISQINLIDLNFNPNLEKGFQQAMPLEKDLLMATEKILAADHFVWVYPMWWYSMPAVMKGFIDRVFLPGTTFKYSKGNSFPEKLLIGKTARIIITSDTPNWYDYLFMKRPAINQFKKGTLEFCGVGPVKVSFISPIKHSTDAFRKKHLDKTHQLGIKQT